MKNRQITDHGPDHVRLALTLPDGEGGFRDKRHLSASLALLNLATPHLSLQQATTDARTRFNAHNHRDGNLDGKPGRPGDALKIATDRHLPRPSPREMAPLTGMPCNFTTCSRPSRPAIPAFASQLPTPACMTCGTCAGCAASR